MTLSPEAPRQTIEPTIAGISVLDTDVLNALPFMDSSQLDGDNAIFRPIYEVVVSALVDPQDSATVDGASRALEIINTVLSSDMHVTPLRDTGGYYLEQKFELLYVEGDSGSTTVTVGYQTAQVDSTRYYHGYIETGDPNITAHPTLEVQIIGDTAKLWLNP